ncbi:MAG: hypothetical protein L6422_06730 [Candidatus Marinimicrobia bacterium]|nr:hypothetical protein [bacterium]MCG2715963.1 hypothetical protein [Candidatus Neomarinimicrobiota bacterium]
MEALIDKLVSQPIYLGAAVILIISLFFAFLKKLAKIGIVIGLVLMLYLGYLALTGKNSTEIEEVIIEKGKETMEKIEEKAEKVVKQKIIDQKKDLKNK